jgi:SAM-dependent methyltransferase
LSLLLNRTYPGDFVGIDIAADYAEWIQISGITGFEVMDATALTFADGTFDRVFSISTIEHISDDGDVRAAQEMGRVLKPGGRAVLTFEWGPLFVPWCDFPVGGRIYSTASFLERIVAPSGLALAEPLEYPAAGVPAEAQADIAQWAACPPDLFCPAAAVLGKG